MKLRNFKGLHVDLLIREGLIREFMLTSGDEPEWWKWEKFEMGLTSKFIPASDAWEEGVEKNKKVPNLSVNDKRTGTGNFTKCTFQFPTTSTTSEWKLCNVLEGD